MSTCQFIKFSNDHAAEALGLECLRIDSQGSVADIGVDKKWPPDDQIIFAANKIFRLPLLFALTFISASER